MPGRKIYCHAFRVVIWVATLLMLGADLPAATPQHQNMSTPPDSAANLPRIRANHLRRGINFGVVTKENGRVLPDPVSIKALGLHLSDEMPAATSRAR